MTDYVRMNRDAKLGTCASTAHWGTHSAQTSRSARSLASLGCERYSTVNVHVGDLQVLGDKQRRSHARDVDDLLRQLLGD